MIEDTQRLITLIAVMILVISCIIFSIYIAYPLMIKRNELLLQKRSTKLTLTCIFLLLLWMIPVTMVDLIALDILPQSRLLEVIRSQLSFAFHATLAFRFWLVWFDIRYFMFLSADEWKCIINDDHHYQTNFFLKYKSTLGNQKFILKILAICILIDIIADILLYCLTPTNFGHASLSSLSINSVMYWTFMAGCAFIYTYLYWKLKLFTFTLTHTHRHTTCYQQICSIL